MQNKLHHLVSQLTDGELDIAIVTETWFKTQQNNYTATLKDNGFSIFHFNREEKVGGGVAVIYRHCLKLHSAKSYNFTSFECILVSISSSTSQKITFVVIYRLGEVSASVFLTEFFDFFEKIHTNVKTIIT